MVLTPAEVLLALLATTTLAQSSSERVWSSFAFILNGDRTPLTGDVPPTLTPLGAQQLHSQGSFFRDRYLVNRSLSAENDSINSRKPIVGINRDAIDNRQLAIYSDTSDYKVGSSLAFMQGLYPPNSLAFPYISGGLSTSQLTNGSFVNYPLGGYQYPNIQTLSVVDPSSIGLQGHLTCTNYWSSIAEFRANAAMSETYDATYDFYQNLWAKAFEGSPFGKSSVNFNHAYDLWDYASYQYNHNTTVRGNGGTEVGLLRASELAALRHLANQQQYSLNGNLTAYARRAGDGIRAIAGRTLAGRINSEFQMHLASRRRQRTRKLSLMFGSFEPLLAFFALAGLADEHGSGLFMQIPPAGSAMVFELYSVGGGGEPEDDDLPADEDDLWVRFLYRNGTGADEPLRQYPLFGRPRAETAMSWGDFYRNMEGIAVSDLPTWCELCDSANLFCSALIDNNSGSDDSSSPSSSSSGGDGGGGHEGPLSPAVAGVIGALTAFATLTLLAAGAWVIAGVRLTRRGDPRRRSSSLGGFKGAEKLTPDHDVSIARNGAKHARVGSWELGGPGAPPPPPPQPSGDVSPLSPGSGGAGVIIGASIKRDGDDDADSVSGRVPVKPLESV